MTTSQQLAKSYTEIKTFFDSNKSAILQALPRHLDIDRVLRVALTELRNNPKLLECDKTSIFSCLINASMLGLEIGNGLGHAYIVPFFNGKNKRWDGQLIIGYRGMIDLARRSGQVISITAQVVYDNDFFEFEYGLNPKLRHIPNFESHDKAKLIGAYAVAKLKHDGEQFVFIPKHKIEETRAKVLSKIKNQNMKEYSPWTTSFDEMAKKTAVRALFKYLPVSIEIQRAISLDEQAENDKRQYSELDTNIFDHSVEPDNTKDNNSDIQKEKLDELTNQLNEDFDENDIPGFDDEIGEN